MYHHQVYSKKLWDCKCRFFGQVFVDFNFSSFPSSTPLYNVFPSRLFREYSIFRDFFAGGSGMGCHTNHTLALEFLVTPRFPDRTFSPTTLTSIKTNVGQRCRAKVLLGKWMSGFCPTSEFSKTINAPNISRPVTPPSFLFRKMRI
ncbi:hypothetical protein RhiirC2_717049 [Rhizophagus irregularis]|uniref:Uncharacterized protein n=1 Tax=Rhizophagus irregularis TaxID=588596 RepID=A0A2N1MP12_9GLOM|nr:hypothetical protein RhiirC2_717049 [Rhizophagus irregularis]